MAACNSSSSLSDLMPEDETCTSFEPLHDYLLISPIAEERISRGGIQLPDSTQPTNLVSGEVISIGPGRQLPTGKFMLILVAEGDVVIYNRLTATTTVDNEGDALHLVRYSDVIAVKQWSGNLTTCDESDTTENEDLVGSTI